MNSKKKDIIEKNLEDFNDVFADIFNALVLSDRNIKIEPDELHDAKSRSVYIPSLSSDEGDIREQERDTVKFWDKGELFFCLMGLENQSVIDKTMPLRAFGYEGGDYRHQVTLRDDAIRSARLKNDFAEIRKIYDKKFYPVITVVLYFGIKTRWKKPLSLLECLNIPKELDGLVEDRHIKVIELAWLSEEQEKLFKSDFRILVSMLRQIRLTGKYVPSDSQDIIHFDAVMRALKAFTGHKIFEEARIKFADTISEGRKIKVIDILKGSIEMGKSQGLTQGLSQGLAQGLSQGLSRGIDILRNMGVSQDLIDKFKSSYIELGSQESQKDE